MGQILLNGKPLGANLKPKAPTPPPTAPTPPAPYTNPTSPGVALSATNPSADLRGQTIGVGPTANREQLASSYLKNYDAATEPYFKRDVRQATSNAAANGQLRSGQLRTSLGDLALNRDIQRDAAGQNFLTNALQGSIDDAYKNVGIAQQQQAFQTGLQGQAFNQALQQFLAGSSGNPSDAQFLAAQQAGNSASAGSAALQAYLQSLGRGGTSTMPPISDLPAGVLANDPVYQGVYG